MIEAVSGTVKIMDRRLIKVIKTNERKPEIAPVSPAIAEDKGADPRKITKNISGWIEQYRERKNIARLTTFPDLT